MFRFVVVLAVVLLGCGPRPSSEADAGSDAGAGVGKVRIVTETLASAKVGESYTQPLSAVDGTPPYGWVIVSKAPALTWLNINGTTGTLSGIPGAAGTGMLSVAVTDQSATTITKDFSLAIASCQSGTNIACTTASAGVCSVGTQACVDGQLSGSCVGTPSSDRMKCGATCGACDSVTADRCSMGTCACGTGSACATGSTCCGGTCKSLDDVASCGACGNDCRALTATGVTATCASRQCAFACSAPNLNHCVGNTSVPPKAGDACETDVSTSAVSCGSCGHACAPSSNQTTVTGYPCVTGQCQVTCATQYLNCNNASEDGCEVAVSTSNCGSCSRVCQPGLHAGASCQSQPNGWQCGFACEPNYDHCVAGNSVPPGEAVACESNLMTDRNNCGTCGHQCTADQACVNGSCMCQNALCGAGQICLSTANRCGCDSSMCASGCCTAQGAGGSCVEGTNASACGAGGATCSVCTTTGCPTKCTVSRTGFCSCSGSTAGVCVNQACECLVQCP